MRNKPIKSKNQHWLAIEFEVEPKSEELAGWLMMSRGANGCEFDKLDSGQVKVRASFESEKIQKPDQFNSLFEEYGIGKALGTMRVSTIEEKDWLSEWKKGFEPFAVGQKFIVSPPWHKEEAKSLAGKEKLLILIEPAMAFGTGLHTTTRYCLRQIEKLPDFTSVLDVGTGSGILAIAAKLLNPNAVVTGVDICEAAVNSALENLKLNNLAGQIDITLSSIEKQPNLAFDLIFSNLTFEDISALLLDYLRLLKPGGKIICAGILKEKLPLLEKAIATYPLNIMHSEIEGEWVGVTMERIPVVFKM